MKKFLIIVYCLMVFLFGCLGGGPQPGPAEGGMPVNVSAANESGAAPVLQKPFPLKLEYNFPKWAGNERIDVEVTYWLEREDYCEGRQAVLGILREAEGRSSSWRKITVFLDDGTYAHSKSLSVGDMAFDGATPGNVEYNLALLLNDLFAEGGKNFLTSSVWQSDEPVVLRNVSVYGSQGMDASIYRKGSGSGVVECTEFGVVVKGANEEISVCVANITQENLLPFVVWIRQGENTLWELKKVSREKPSGVRVLECMKRISCKAVMRPSGDEVQACEQGGGVMKEFRDEQGCTLNYSCVQVGNLTLTIIVKAPNGELVKGLEVDLWTADAPPGGPNAGVEPTGADGRAVFRVSPGSYKVGFNAINFPKEYEYPAQYEMRVEENFEHIIDLKTK